MSDSVDDETHSQEPDVPFRRLSRQDRGRVLACQTWKRCDRLARLKDETRTPFRSASDEDIDEVGLYQQFRTALLQALRNGDEADLLARANQIFPTHLRSIIEGQPKWDAAASDELGEDLAILVSSRFLNRFLKHGREYFASADADIDQIAQQSLTVLRDQRQEFVERAERERLNKTIIPHEYFPVPVDEANRVLASVVTTPPELAGNSRFDPPPTSPTSSRLYLSGYTPFGEPVHGMAHAAKPSPVVSRSGAKRRTKRRRAGGRNEAQVYCDEFYAIRCNQLADHRRVQASREGLDVKPDPDPPLESTAVIYAEKFGAPKDIDTIRKHCLRQIEAGRLRWEWRYGYGPVCPADDDA